MDLFKKLILFFFATILTSYSVSSFSGLINDSDCFDSTFPDVKVNISGFPNIRLHIWNAKKIRDYGEVIMKKLCVGPYYKILVQK